MSGTDTHAQGSPRERERPQGGEPKAAEKFVKTAAEEAYKKFAATTNFLVSAEVDYAHAGRKWALGLVEWGQAVFPKPVTATMRRRWEDIEGEPGEFKLPPEILKHLASVGCTKPPHGGSSNFLMAMAAPTILRAKIEKKVLTSKEATEALEASQDIVRQRKVTHALSSSISLWAKFALGIFDMERPELADKPLLAVVAEYDKWRQRNPTLCGKPYSRKSTDKPIKDEKAEQDKNLREILSAVRQPVDDDDLVYDDDTSPTTISPAGPEPYKAEETSRATSDLADTFSLAPSTPETPEAARVETHVDHAQANDATLGIVEAVRAEPLAQARPPTVNSDLPEWVSFTESFDRPRAPVSAKLGKTVKKEIGLEQPGEEGFIRYKIDSDGEVLFLGVRHSIEP